MSKTFVDGVVIGCLVTTVATVLAVWTQMIMIIPLMIVVVLLWALIVGVQTPK